MKQFPKLVFWIITVQSQPAIALVNLFPSGNKQRYPKVQQCLYRMRFQRRLYNVELPFGLIFKSYVNLHCHSSQCIIHSVNNKYVCIICKRLVQKVMTETSFNLLDSRIFRSSLWGNPGFTRLYPNPIFEHLFNLFSFY